MELFVAGEKIHDVHGEVLVTPCLHRVDAQWPKRKLLPIARSGRSTT